MTLLLSCKSHPNFTIVVGSTNNSRLPLSRHEVGPRGDHQGAKPRKSVAMLQKHGERELPARDPEAAAMRSSAQHTDDIQSIRAVWTVYW